MKRFLLLLISALILLSGCSAAPERYSATYADVFDTVTQLTVYCSSQKEFNEFSEAAHSELLLLHEIFDIYNTYDGLINAKSLNDSAGEAVEVSSWLIDVIESAIEWYSLSGGRLNAAMGSVLSFWHDCRENEILPDTDELSERAKHCNIDNVVIDGNVVTLADPEMSLDFGAFAKGYAAEMTARLLESMGAENFVLSVGGNVVTRGEKPEGKWEIGVENPDGGLVAVVKVSDKAIVTSGDYQRYFEVDGVRYHHIIDPETLYPADIWRSVTIICDRSDVADALSTALFCMPLDEGRALIKEYGAEALWVDKSGAVTRSEGFSDYE